MPITTTCWGGGEGGGGGGAKRPCLSDEQDFIEAKNWKG